MTDILDKAYQLYLKYETCDPYRICEYLGINLMYADLPPVTDGMYFSVENNKIILVNQNISQNKARYVIAHELGHALLHPDQNYMYMAGRTFMKTGRYENEADYFCVSLLLCEILKNNLLENMTSLQISQLAGIPEKMVSMWMKNTDVAKLSNLYN